MSTYQIALWRQCQACGRAFRVGATERPRYCSYRCAERARDAARAPRPGAVGA
jgi:hypothetical protein